MCFRLSECSFPHQTVSEQATTCKGTVSGVIYTCDEPVISYGSVNGGLPTEHGGNDYNKWCEEMGFDSYSGTVQTKVETIVQPKGWVFGCSDTDNQNWHWCDVHDGYWLNQTLDGQGENTRIVQVQCKLKNNEVPICKGNKFIYDIKSIVSLEG